MTLNCSAYNCTYNQSGTCYAGKITISGTKATNSSNTHCSTFSESNGNLTNLSSNYFTTSNDIICKAVNHTFDHRQCIKGKKQDHNRYHYRPECFVSV